jgi:hypothetical protein
MIDQTKEVGSGFKKKNVVVTDEQYPTISVQFVQDKCDLLTLFK